MPGAAAAAKDGDGAHASGSPSFDVTHFSLHVSKRVVGAGHWLEDLRPYLTNPELTSSRITTSRT